MKNLCVVLLLGVVISGCATNNKINSQVQANWDSYFDNDNVRAVNENNRSLDIKTNLKKAL